MSAFHPKQTFRCPTDALLWHAGAMRVGIHELGFERMDRLVASAARWPNPSRAQVGVNFVNFVGFGR
jgi:hypothetical protein